MGAKSLRRCSTSLKEGVGGDESVRHDVHGLGEAKKVPQEVASRRDRRQEGGSETATNDATSREKNGGTE